MRTCLSRDRVFPQPGIDPAGIRQAEGVTGTYEAANFAPAVGEVIPFGRAQAVSTIPTRQPINAASRRAARGCRTHA